jgi:hypothetical protein
MIECIACWDCKHAQEHCGCVYAHERHSARAVVPTPPRTVHTMGVGPSRNGIRGTEGQFYNVEAHPPLRVLEDKGVQTVMSYRRCLAACSHIEY